MRHELAANLSTGIFWSFSAVMCIAIWGKVKRVTGTRVKLIRSYKSVTSIQIDENLTDVLPWVQWCSGGRVSDS